MASIRGPLRWAVGLAGAVSLAGAAHLAISRGATRAEASEGHARHAGMAHDMDEAAMRRETQVWFAAHPAHGGSVLAAAADTFRVSSFRFDSDGIAGTVIDTAKIEAGQSILFKWVDGFHTTTSGNPGDVNAGSLWDAPIDNLQPANLEFSVAFAQPGTFPFFCRPHGSFFNMKGVVVVKPGSVGVPGAPDAGRIGFTRAPSPNPTQRGVVFQFALARAGHARAEVFDAGGRRVAIVLNRDLGVGVHDGSWNGRGAGGAACAAGVYYLRLTIPEAAETRRIVVER